MRIATFSGYVLGVCAAAAMLPGCGGSQPPIAAPGAMPKSQTSVIATRAGGGGSSYKVLYRFSLGGRGHSARPATSVVDVNGTLYGTTLGHFGSGNGTIYKISPAGVFKTLYRFHRSDGSEPKGTLIDVNGTLYGTTSQGGSFGVGVVFSITTDGKEKVLYNFKGGLDGAGPQGALINLKGRLYGTTFQGGSYSCSCGTVYTVTTTGTEKVLYSFKGGYPYAGLTDVSGRLYGATSAGGSFGYGTVYSINSLGSLNVLYSFHGGSDAGTPLSPLLNVNGTLYGTTFRGGSSRRGSLGGGTVYRVSTDGTEKVLYRFKRAPGGIQPDAGLFNVNGTLYGTTSRGGSGCDALGGCGVVYAVTTAGLENVVHRFSGTPDGESPDAEFVGVDGTLYGTTYSGGGSGCYGDGCGTVFSLHP